MNKINYKVGDIVALIDGVHYRYLGRNKKLRSYLYDPIEPQVTSIFFTLTDEECAKYGYNIGVVPFACKMDVNIKIIKKE